MSDSLGPAARPCGSCPYRKDVPSGVWAASEYERLAEYDKSIHEQPMQAFGCHQRDGHLCAGWCGTHGAENLLGFRLMARDMFENHGPEEVERTYDYVSPVPLWESGAAARDHGLLEIDDPSPEARALSHKIVAAFEDVHFASDKEG